MRKDQVDKTEVKGRDKGFLNEGIHKHACLLHLKFCRSWITEKNTCPSKYTYSFFPLIKKSIFFQMCI